MTTMKLDDVRNENIINDRIYWEKPGNAILDIATVVAYFGVSFLLVTGIALVGYAMA